MIMKELIDEQVFITALTAAAIALFVLGIIIYILGRKKRAAASLAGLVMLAGGPAIWIFWQIYAAVTKHFGLDSVKGLGINIAIFVTAGLVLGGLIGIIAKKRKAEI